MKTMDWRELAIGDGILTEPTSDANRLILWVRRDRDQNFQYWERITSVVHASVEVEQGLCSTEATSIPAKKAVRGGLGTLWKPRCPSERQAQFFTFPTVNPSNNAATDKPA